MPDWLDPLLTQADNGSSAAASPTSKRTLIVEAARAVLLREGIARLSMRRVAKEAGVALGLAHYYFTSKSALVAAVVDADTRCCSEPAGDPLPDRLADLLPAPAGEPLACLRLGADIDSQALREPLVAGAAALARREREARLLQRLRAARLLPATPGGEPLAALLMAALDGLALRAAIDPGFDPAAACGALDRLLTGARGR